MIACIILIRALELREHEDKLSRELALLLIALAAGLKIYPAIFGLLYLKDKRYKEAERLIIYGIVFFFGPFIFFGGLHGLMQMFRNQLRLHSIVYYGWRNIQEVWNKLDKEFLFLNIPVIGKVMTGIYAVIAMTGAWILDDIWKRLFLLCSFIIIVPSWSGSYTMIYLVIPLIYFLCGERNKRSDYLYAVLFAGIFCFFTWNTPSITQITGDISWLVRYMSVYVASLILIMETVWKGTGMFRIYLSGRKMERRK